MTATATDPAPHPAITIIDLGVAGRTLDNICRLFGPAAELSPPVAKVIADVGLARLSINAAIEQLGGQR